MSAATVKWGAGCGRCGWLDDKVHATRREAVAAQNDHQTHAHPHALADPEATRNTPTEPRGDTCGPPPRA